MKNNKIPSNFYKIKQGGRKPNTIEGIVPWPEELDYLRLPRAELGRAVQACSHSTSSCGAGRQRAGENEAEGRIDRDRSPPRGTSEVQSQISNQNLWQQQKRKVCICPGYQGLVVWLGQLGGEAPERQVRLGAMACAWLPSRLWVRWLRSHPHTCPLICGTLVHAGVTLEVTGEQLGSPLAPVGPSPG